jgi:hypothetical protein
MTKLKIKTLFAGKAWVHQKYLRTAKLVKSGLILEYKGKTMTVENETPWAYDLRYEKYLIGTYTASGTGSGYQTDIDGYTMNVGYTHSVSISDVYNFRVGGIDIYVGSASGTNSSSYSDVLEFLNPSCSNGGSVPGFSDPTTGLGTRMLFACDGRGFVACGSFAGGLPKTGNLSGIMVCDGTSVINAEAKLPVPYSSQALFYGVWPMFGVTSSRPRA